MKVFQCVMSSLIFCMLLIITFILIKSNNEDVGRYVIHHSSSGPTIMLDKKTGLTYRNIECDKTLNCWQVMEFKGYDLKYNKTKVPKAYESFWDYTEETPTGESKK